MTTQELIQSIQTILYINKDIESVHFNDKLQVWYGDEHVPAGYNDKLSREEVMNWKETESEIFKNSKKVKK